MMTSFSEMAGEERRSLALGAEKKSEKRKGSVGAIVMSWNSVLLGLLNFAGPVWRQDAPVSTGFTFCSYELEDRVLACSQEFIKHTSDKSCEKLINTIAGFVLNGSRSIFHKLVNEFFERLVFIAEP